MNTIIIHSNNRVTCTAMHDLSAALIAPVSKWYRKPTPWWVDGFEEQVGLQPIVEADEIAVDVEEDALTVEDEQIESVDLAGEEDVFMDMQFTHEGAASRLIHMIFFLTHST